MPRAASATPAFNKGKKLDQKKINEVSAFIWFSISVFTLFALLTYTPYDISFEVSVPNSPLKNFAGPAGAYTGWVLMILFGKTSYFLIPIFLFWALSKWTGRRSQKLWLKIFSIVVFFSSACALFSLFGEANEINRFQSGGIIGFFVSNFLTTLFGKAGVFVAFSLFALSIILTTELLLLQITMEVFKKIRAMILASKAGSEKAQKNEKPEPPKLLLKTTVRPAPIPVKKEEPKLKMDSRIDPKDLKEKEAPKPEIRTKPEIKLSVPRPEPKQTEKPAAVNEMPTMADDTKGDYRLPPTDILQNPPAMDTGKVKDDLEASSKILEDTLHDFGIDAKVVEVEQGPTITRYELQPAAGVKVAKITSLENDIALAMRAHSVRIIAPIPGKTRVGIEVPNSATATVYLKEVLLSPEYQKETSKISIVIGKDTAGLPLVCNLADMPHLLIAGATNTGKSVCINSIISSMLFRATPDEVKFLMIDPKMVELHFYNELPHLICPVVTDKAKAPVALGWAVNEMERRYKLLSKVGAKNILAFNEKVQNKEIDPKNLMINEANQDEPIVVKKMPYIVVVIDELADLMMTSQQEVEASITRLAQLARAVGIHMIIATQRPSVDVITGVIKANFPARIAFQVASKVDSRTILDENGADKLLGRGDCLMMDPRKSKLVRGQGAWVQDKEIEKMTNFIKNQRKAVYQEGVTASADKKTGAFSDFKRDEVYEEARRVVLETGQASVSMVQRRLGLGYTRAARLIDMMEEDGVVGPYRGAKPREILIDRPNAKAGAPNSEEDKEAAQ